MQIQSYLLLKTLPPALQIFWRPMLLISLAVHGIFLALPMPPESKSEPPPPKKEAVKITQLLAPPSSPAPQPSVKPLQPTPQSTPQPSLQRTTPPPQPKVASPPPVPIPKPTPKPEPPKEEEVSQKQPKEKAEETSKKQPKEQEKPKQEQKEPQTNPQPEEEKPPQKQQQDNQAEQQPQEDIQKDNSAAVAEAGKGLLEELRPRILDRLAQSTNDPSAMREYLDTLPYGFVKSEQQPYFFEGEDELKKEALAFLAIPQTNPQGAYDDYLKPVVEEELGFKIDELGESYGGANLYKAENEAKVEFYMNIVKLTGTGAFVVIWPKDPRTN